ncbi:MAG: hypothetical protein R3F37_17360 [Candidatus Competibacteraceae bacterium]
MRPAHYTLTANEVYRYAANLLQPHLQWQDHGPKCLVATLLKVLFYAAGQLCSLFAACGRLRETPSDQAVRNALTALCPQTQTLERRLNASFAAQLPKAGGQGPTLALSHRFESAPLLRPGPSPP